MTLSAKTNAGRLFLFLLLRPTGKKKAACKEAAFLARINRQGCGKGLTEKHYQISVNDNLSRERSLQ